MDVVTLALARRYAAKVAAGFSSVSVDEATSTIVFTLNDGKKVSLKVPTPKDGVSVTSITTNEQEHLIINYSDGRTEDIGLLPKQRIAVSKDSGNALQNRKDGLYVSTTGVLISEDEDNALITKEDGLFVANLKSQKEDVDEIINDFIENDTASQDDIEDLFDDDDLDIATREDIDGIFG